MDKISVIVPVYNSSKYLSKCIDSIINQTYKNIEILLIDDGSTDDSGKVCDDYSLKDNRIRVIHKKNGGTSSARNTGLDNVTGNFIYFIDSDDYIKNDVFEYLLQLISKYQADIAYITSYIYVNEDYLPINDAWKPRKEEITIYNNLESVSLFLEEKIPGNICDKLFKKDLFLNIRFPDGYLCEDLDTTYRLFAKSQKMISSSLSKYFYLSRSTSQMGSDAGFDKLINSIILVTKRLIEFYKNNYPSLQIKATYYALDQLFIMYITLMERSTHKHLREKFETVIENYINIVKGIDRNDRLKKTEIKIFLYKINKHLLVFLSEVIRKMREFKLKLILLIHKDIIKDI